MSARTRKRRKLKADINVVPYIDVMLVLLIIFMVTAPLLNLGVDVDLPDSKAKPIEQKKDFAIAVITPDGRYQLKLQNADNTEMTKDALAAAIGAFHTQSPDVPVYIAANGDRPYREVVELMGLLQAAGIPKVALMSKPEQAGSAAKDQ